MSKKIAFAIVVVLGFIMLSLTNMCVGRDLAIPHHEIPPIPVEHDGDLWCLEPKITKIKDGRFDCQVRFRNKDMIYIVPGGWEAKVIWHEDPEKEIGHGTYMNNVSPNEYRDDFHIEITPVSRGLHWVPCCSRL